MLVDLEGGPGICLGGEVELQFQLTVTLVGDVEDLTGRLVALHEFEVGDARLHGQVELHVLAETLACGDVIGLSGLYVRGGLLAEAHALEGV